MVQEILGQAKTVRQLLGVKYTIDLYQREYKWERKQIQELVEDLTDKFLENYRPGHPREAVENYSHYFLGSIIISRKGNVNYIVDGQQRLTSLTLFLIYLNNQQEDHPEPVPIADLIFSTKFGKKSFNLDVDERTPVMNELFEGRVPDVTGQSESVRNLVDRYLDIDELTTSFRRT